MSGKKIWAVLMMLAGAGATVAGGVIIAEGIIKYIHGQRQESGESRAERRLRAREAAE